LRDGGLFWWNAANMRANLYGDTLNPREFSWSFSLSLTTAPDILFAALGIFTIIAELSYGMVLFSRMARRIWPVLAMMMHLGILLLQRILFLDLILIQFVFFDFSRIRKAIGQRLARRRGPIQILYDGSCGYCRRSVRLLACLDMFQRLEFLDFRVLDLNEYNRARALKLESANLEKEMYVVSRGEAYHGFYGYRAIVLAVPLFWLMAPWLFLPIVSSMSAWIYGFIARHPMNPFNCDSHVPRQAMEGVGVASFPHRNSAFREFRYSLALAAIVLVTAVCWRYHVEFFPLTSWDVYSYSDVSGKVTYVKVSGRDDSGKTFHARLEDGIGALSYDARYSRVLQNCFGRPAAVDVCKKFLTASASAYNKKVLPGRRLMQYEIQKWTWDFRNHPTDPQYGNLTDRFVFAINGRDSAVNLTESQ
jgi:predicted DCC family thiol-disulfide oxidoreductase YuxK